MAYSILIVDDSLPMRSVIKRTLKAAGLGQSEILEADNGRQALELMQGAWIDIIFTDYNMPEMNGMEFIKSVKADEISKDIPVVVISTEGNEKRINEFMEAGAAGYITKPFTAEAIRDLIVKIMGDIAYEDDADDSDDDLDF